MNWGVKYFLNDLRVELVIPPPRYVRAGEWFLLPVVVGTRNRPLELSASISLNERLLAWAYSEISFRGEYFFVFRPLRFVRPGLWHLVRHPDRLTPGRPDADGWYRQEAG